MALSRNSLCGMNFHYIHHTLNEFLDDAARYQLTQIEIWGAAPHFYIGDRTLADARALGHDLHDCGMRLAFFTPEQCVYPINIASRLDDLRDRSIRYFVECLEMSAEMGSASMLVTPGSGFVTEAREDAFGRCVDALGFIADRAGRLGMGLFLEALPPAWSNIATTAAELRRLLDAVGSPVMKGMLDTSGATLMGESVRDYVAELGDRLGHVHMTDSDAAGSHLVWGDGMLPLDDYIADLNAADYAGLLSIKLTSPRYYLSPEPALRTCVERLSSAIG